MGKFKIPSVPPTTNIYIIFSNVKYNPKNLFKYS